MGQRSPLTDREEALAIAEYELRRANGETGPLVPHAEVRRMLGPEDKRRSVPPSLYGQ